VAARNTRSLVLEIAGDPSKLTAASKVARSALLELQQGAESVEAAVRQSFANMAPADSVRRAEREFERMFRNIRANAQAVLAEGNTSLGAQLFDVGAADEQVRALTANAAQLRQWSQAAELASKEGGEFAARQQQIAVALAAEATQLEQQALDLDRTAMAFREIQAQVGSTDAAMRRSTAVTGDKRAALQQLSFQLNDVAVQFAAGTPPMQIFAMQGGQVIQALQMMRGSAGGLLGFLGGPWGLVLTTATIALTPFVAKLWEGEDAAKAAEAGADALGQAQSALGGIFDLTSGKIENQNQLLRLNARLMALNLRAEALQKGESSANTFRNARRQSTSDFVLGSIAADLPGDTAGEANSRRISAILNGVARGNISLEDALKRSETLDFRGVNTTRQAFQQAIIDRATADNNVKVADLIDQSLDSGSLAPDLRRPGSTKRDRKQSGPSAEETARRFNDQLIGYTQQSLSAMQQSASTAEERAELELRSIEWSRRQELARIDADEHFSAAQKAELSAAVDRLSDYQRENVDLRTRQELLDQQLRLDQQDLDGKIGVLRLQSQLADTLDERRQIALQILEYELQERRNAADRLLASNDAADRAEGQRQLDQIGREETLQREQIDRDFADPVESYVQRLRAATYDLDTAFKEVEANGLQALEDGLVGVISGTESVASAFKKMANQIIADLVRIAVQKLILNTISGGFFGLFSEGGPVEGHAAGGFITGPGSATSDSIPALLSNGEFVINAAATSRYRPLLEAINDGRVPGFAAGGIVPRQARLPELSRLAAGRSATTVEQHFHVDARGAVLAAELVAEMRRIGASAAIGGSQLAQSDLADAQFSTLP